MKLAKLWQPALSQFIWLGLAVAIIGLNIVYVSRPSTKSYNMAILTSPNQWENYVRLAQALYGQKNIPAAKAELHLALERFIPSGKANVLGATTDDPQVILAKWDHDPATQRKIRAYWETIIKEYPKYEDGYVILAILAHNAGEDTLSAKYLTTAESLNSGNPTLLQARKRLKI